MKLTFKYETVARWAQHVTVAVLVLFVAYAGACLALMTTGWTHPGFTTDQARILSMLWIPPFISVAFLQISMLKWQNAILEAKSRDLSQRIHEFVAGEVRAHFGEEGITLLRPNEEPPRTLN